MNFTKFVLNIIFTPMLRRIITPKEKTLTLEIPESLMGQEVEILVFAINQEERVESKQVSFSKRTKDLRHSSGGYKFNRLEANEYE
jgi:hypothetical protein